MRKKTLEWFTVWYKKLIFFFFCDLVSLKQLSPSSPQISCSSSFRFVLTHMPCCVRTSKWLNPSPKKNFLCCWDLWRKIWIVRSQHFVKALCHTQKRFLFDLTFKLFFFIFFIYRQEIQKFQVHHVSLLFRTLNCSRIMIFL